ncbi:TPA_asm: hypothetical protein vir530_00036 [dsDNA virus vir530]|nr:TPA_asm: hypothetical protein vir530_00036 [dsDNA virus vir530]
MATSCVMNLSTVTSITGNALTMNGETFGSTGLGTLTIANISAKKNDLVIVGDIHGFLRFPFADPDTLEGYLAPADLKTAQIKLTQGGAGATLVLLAEEVFGY